MKKTIRVIIFLVFSLTIMMVTAVYAAPSQNPTTPQTTTPWTQLQRVDTTHSVTNGEFGYAVAIDGDTAVVGERNGNNSAGAVYVYVHSGGSWSQQQRLTASDARLNDFFGWSVDVSGDTIIIGSPGDDDDGNASGSVYIFVRNGTTWTEQQKITATDGDALSFFGSAVAIDGDSAAIGAYNKNSRTGAAYVFTRSNVTWSQQQKLTANDAAANDYFGYTVAIDGDSTIVGAYRKNDAVNGNDSGAAYMFTRSGTTWSAPQKLTASNATASDYFGISVAIDGTTALIGAYGDNGQAYVFGKNAGTWSEKKILTASDAEAIDKFGFSVSLSGATAVIGAYAADSSGTTDNKGAAYVFVGADTVWNEQQIITASDGEEEDQFGYAVAVNDNTIFVGSRYVDGDRDNMGAAYIFTRIMLSVDRSGAGNGSVSSSPAGIDCGADCSETYDYGTAVTLTATADSQSYFTGWSGACSGTGNCVVTMNTAEDVVANFAPYHYIYLPSIIKP